VVVSIQAMAASIPALFAVSGNSGEGRSFCVLHANCLLDELCAPAVCSMSIMTREDDTFIPLAEPRVVLLMIHHADLFISVHADSLVRHRDMRARDRLYACLIARLMTSPRSWPPASACSEMLAGMERDARPRPAMLPTSCSIWHAPGDDPFLASPLPRILVGELADVPVRTGQTIRTARPVSVC
jgi:hypothetical protein